MIKIFNTQQIKEADSYTIQYEPVFSIQLMERAAEAFVCQLEKDFPDHNPPIHIFCGNGNNGGDGLAIARILLDKGYKVTIYIFPVKKYSIDCKKNLIRLQKKYKTSIHYISSINFIEQIPLSSIIIDAIFGTGLKTSIQQNSIHYEVIHQINNRNFYQVVAVDIPSGLFVDQPTHGIVIRADKTYTFQFPKLSFFLPENGKYVNNFKVLNINLHSDYITNTTTLFYYITANDIREKIKKRKKYSHKGTYGHAFIIAGSYGRIGAAILAGKACLRTGCGLLTIHVPSCGYQILQTAFPEAMCSIDKNAKYITSILVDEKYDSIAIGPGIGMHITTIRTFETFLKNAKTSVVIDADSINILSKKRKLIKLLPENSILTPHPIEFERLVGKWTDDFERLLLQQKFSKKHRVIVILKGANTSISDANGNVYFNSTGNAGMATAGSGDVLTGIINGFLAQQYLPIDSAVLGVYIHGLAGDLALNSQSMESLIASDIIANLGSAFKEIKDSCVE